MSRNGQPYVRAIDLPLCLVCGKGFTPGEKVVVSEPDLIFIHLGCVEDVDEARKLMDRHRETGGE